MKSGISKLITFISIVIFFIACIKVKRIDIPESTFIRIAPVHGNVTLFPLRDTLTFQLDLKTFNTVKSVTSFVMDGRGYISFLDARSRTINIYNVEHKNLVMKMALDKYFERTELKGLTVFVQNFDSIYIANKEAVYLLDTTARIKLKLKYDDANAGTAFFDIFSPPVIMNKRLYVGIRSHIDDLSFEQISKSPVIYAFNPIDKSQELVYRFPQIYQDKILGDHFIKANFCVNDKGYFVFSFPADTNIYETNFVQYHNSYLAKSQLQSDTLTPVPKIEIERDNGFKQYAIRDAYGPIYYDQFNKRYLRVFKQRMSDSAYESNRIKRKYSFVILDQNFRIIGEGDLPEDVSYSSVFFLKDQIYARTNFNDEYALHFVKLSYTRKDSI
ncbi:DUF4221 family protein [Chitinophaga rhizophila]|uniref:DUF4221 domain-containing protein n=1 Tax=Chitinophaga rhizophila TaxID=2866212 RepID=A0ABS7GGS8_9BACT|nr:DUF4221 family protein [Chitinophaga rhizophila]MBW8686330.1 DUF4221 domain-containing protein [Chitinophaga rhizophila]